ncbi:uncharacterized protein EHS24_000694 [Apiotrichum porosum]|uniref:Uncharacterized protein n=1 Tax=Apiotrichum porosum TaxID=105984 RepID=A0A427YAR3_9TREE|nr:uncharacterized protein EHS24_000694 [Apiotrichum porosum]RSH88166.1 hypothetical protein EHS24_000694 [Apiotrichum porosum]
MPLLSTSMPRLHPLLLLCSVAALALAYVMLIANRPSPPDWKKEQDPHLTGFPSWFGGRDSVSPYEEPRQAFVGSPEEILLFIDLRRDSLSLPHAFYLLDVLSSRPDIVLTVTAPWAADWDSDKSVGDNLEAVGCKKRVWRYGDGEVDFGDACRGSTIINEQPSHSLVAPKVNPRADITILPEPRYLLSKDNTYEALVESLGSDWKMGILAHVMPMVGALFDLVANPPGRVYHPKGDAHPSYRSVNYYPRRTTPRSLWPKMPSGKSYTLFHSDISPILPAKALFRDTSGVNSFLPTSELRKFWTSYERRIANHMSTAGICIFEGWQDGLVDDRMAAAMLGGCLVATVNPDVEHATIEHLIIPLSRTDDALPADQFETALGNLTDSDLKKKALNAFVFARNEFTGNIKVDSVLDIVHRYDRGARGYIFPHGFRWTCNSPGEKPVWCPQA